MASLRYTNGLLTVIAVLLAFHLWTMWAVPDHGGLGGSNVAMAPWASTVHATGLSNAGQQRKQMVDLLREISTQSNELASLFTSGRARVRMEENRNGDAPRNR